MEATAKNLSASNLFILIENPGVADPEAFTLLGASNKEGTEAIGQFGSGTKHGVLACLRKNLSPVVFCGNLRLEFGTKPTVFQGDEQHQIQVKLSGKDRDGRSVNRTELLSYVLRFGSLDWKDRVELALREFVSNALDAVGGDHTQVKVCIVDSLPRAKAGTTRVFVPLTDDGQKFVNNIHEWFLQFDPSKVWRKSSIIHKNTPSPAKVYRRGVLVRTVEGAKPSLFDYNLNNLPLDESRVASDYYVAHYAAYALRNSDNPAHFARVLSQGKGTWEAGFDLTGTYDTLTTTQKADRVETWAKAAANVITDDTVIVHEEADDSLPKGKGYKVLRVGDELYKAAREYGLRTAESVLTADEREGRRVDAEAHPAALIAVRNVWDKLLTFQLTRGEKFPAVKTYEEAISGGARTLGLWKDGTVYINRCLLSATETSPELFAVALEEVAHHITKATDNSRDFQEFFIQALTKVWHG